MISRLVNNIPPGEREEDILSFLESQPSYGELTFHASADVGVISLTIPRLYTYQYKEYFIEVIPLNNHLYITCHKVTPGLLTDKYRQIREKLSTLNTCLADFEKEIRLKEYQAREGMRIRMKENTRTMKREIKSELLRLGINVKPGSLLSKLLRV
jgi:hypothetical protein